jgi:hypothetical protein
MSCDSGGEGNGKKGILEIKDREVSGGGRNRRKNGEGLGTRGCIGLTALLMSLRSWTRW